LPPRLEGDDQLRRHLHLIPRPGVACLPRLTLLDLEHPEVAEFDPPLLDQRLRDPVEGSLDGLQGHDGGDAEFVGNRLRQFLFRHTLPPARKRSATTSSRGRHHTPTIIELQTTYRKGVMPFSLPRRHEEGMTPPGHPPSDFLARPASVPRRT